MRGWLRRSHTLKLHRKIYARFRLHDTWRRRYANILPPRNASVVKRRKSQREALYRSTANIEIALLALTCIIQHDKLQTVEISDIAL